MDTGAKPVVTEESLTGRSGMPFAEKVDSSAGSPPPPAKPTKKGQPPAHPGGGGGPPPEVSELYARSVLDVIVEVALLVAQDLRNRPQKYRKVRRHTLRILREFRSRMPSGSD